MTARKLGRDLAVGDVVVFLGQPHLITAFVPHDHIELGPCRIAESGPEWCITIFDDDLVEMFSRPSPASLWAICQHGAYSDLCITCHPRAVLGAA